MGIIRILRIICFILIENILPLGVSVVAIIGVSKIQSISKQTKIILSIIILFVLLVICSRQGNVEKILMLYEIWEIVKIIGQVVLFIFVIKWILKTTSISKTFKIILFIIISVCVCIMLFNYRSETIDERYIKINEIVNNKTLIGLSEEQVVQLLGEPSYKSTGMRPKYYEYSAGTIFEEWFWGRCYHTKYYRLNIWFDKNNLVKNVYIQDITDL